MLIFSRRVGERVKLTTTDGTVIWVAVTGVFGHKASVGFDAPKSIKIDREEIADLREFEAKQCLTPSTECPA